MLRVKSHLHVFKNIPIKPAEGGVSIGFFQIKKWIVTNLFIRKIFSYSGISLHIARFPYLTKPLVTTLILRVMTLGRLNYIDFYGNKVEIKIFSIIYFFLIFLKDLICIPFLFLRINLSLRRIKKYNNKHTLNDGRPLYLRTDLWFGVQSGGSVGHIAGVLNNLRDPLFISTDRIPTIDPGIKCHLFSPSRSYWDFAELPSFESNFTFLRQVKKILGKNPPSFIYQRYSTNSYLGVKLKYFYKVPLVLEYNGSEIWIAKNWGKPLKYEGLSKKIELINLKNANLVVVVSEPMKIELIAMGVDGNKILVNPNGVNCTMYSPKVDGALIRNRLKLEDKIVVGFIGTFGLWHGAEVLANAFVSLLKKSAIPPSNFHLLMIGDGDRMPMVKEIICANGAEDFCTFTGSVPQKDGPLYLAACDILASPHIPNSDGTPFFGSPTKLFEYMAMGKAIVASDLEQVGEVLEHNKTAWMVKPGDIESLVSGMDKLAGDKHLRERLGSAARVEAIRKFAWANHTQKIINKLKDLCYE